MEIKCITPQNFHKLLPEFVRELHDASYIAVDLEFTGIDRSPTVDFLLSPEEAFKAKIAAAQQFSPMQIGIGIFRGDGGLENEVSGQPAPSSCGASASYRSTMLREAGDFRPFEPMAQSLVPLLESMASSGLVTPANLQRMREVQQRLEYACINPSENTSVYDRLHSYNVLDEVNAAIAIAKRWEKYIASSCRHLSVSIYSCYLFPDSAEDEMDCLLTISSKTAEFLRKNEMDMNKWISDGLHFVPFGEYEKSRSKALQAARGQSQETGIDVRLEPLQRWILKLREPNLRMQLYSKLDRIADFLQTSVMGDTIELGLPFINQPDHYEFCNILRAIGLRQVRRLLTRVPPTTEEGKIEIDKDPRYFGTRLLLALVTATRRKKKPLIVHNGFSDLAFLCCAVHRDPPRTLKEFKRVVRDMFPLFYDTRTLACSPCLQYMPNMTGSMTRTYTLLHRQNRRVQLHSREHLSLRDNEDIKEHDAAYDAFTTGALFAYVQEELAKSDADFRRLRCITPVHGSVFSVYFENDEADCIVQPPLAPTYLVRRNSPTTIPADLLREKLSPVSKNITILYNGDYCIVTMLDRGMTSAQRDSIDSYMEDWCERLDLKYAKLDVESRIHQCGIVYISEMGV